MKRSVLRRLLAGGVLAVSLGVGCQAFERRPALRPRPAPVAMPPAVVHPEPAPVAEAAPPPRAMPPLAPAASSQTDALETPPETVTLDAEAEQCADYGHAADYHWLVGDLQFLHVRGVWRLRYAPPGTEDRHGGCVTLSQTVAMTAFRPGQKVRVVGQLLDPADERPSPDYWVRAIRAVAP